MLAGRVSSPEEFSVHSLSDKPGTGIISLYSHGGQLGRATEWQPRALSEALVGLKTRWQTRRRK